MTAAPRHGIQVTGRRCLFEIGAGAGHDSQYFADNGLAVPREPDASRQAMLSGKLMNLRSPVFTALAITLTALGTFAAEEVWPEGSASDLSLFVTLQRFRIYADHCSEKVPQLKPKFDSLMGNLSSHMQGISNSLLSSDTFKGMKDEPVPADISFAFKDSLEDAKRNFERQDVDSSCPKAIQSLSDMDDDALKSDLTQTLVAVQNMIRQIGKKSTR